MIKLQKALIECFKDFSHEIDLENRKDLSELDTILNEFSNNEYSLKLIMDIPNLKLLAVSDNLETLTGFTREDFDKENMLLFLRSILPNGVVTVSSFTQWAVDIFRSQPPNTNFEALKLSICGIQMKLKNGQEVNALIRVKPLEVSDNGFPSICLITLDFATHLMKPDTHWWGRLSYNGDHTHKYHILSNDKKYHYQDILSTREKEVLRLVAEGLESKEIGQKLFISLNTVVNHRRNAVFRTGARDSTALIQIAKMCGIL
jgi:DNA-binding CsgD family transcriptional regulator